MRTSRLGGVPTSLPARRPVGVPASSAFDLGRGRRRPRGAAHHPTVARRRPRRRLARRSTEQRALVDDFRRWAVPPAGLRHPRVPTGHLMTVQSVCLGWHWQPYAYTPHRRRHRRRAGEAAARRRRRARPSRRSPTRSAPTQGARYEPDAAIVNLYAPGARLGLHQDGEEPSDAPVVTISLGDTCMFRLAGVDRRTGPFTDVELRSGDLLVFGGPQPAHLPRRPEGARRHRRPTGSASRPGRLSITVRETGLS